MAGNDNPGGAVVGGAANTAAGQTPTTPIRVTRLMWSAYGRVCARLSRDRTEDLLAHMRRQIKRYGDDADLADLAPAEAELRERRSRKGGRPPKLIA